MEGFMESFQNEVNPAWNIHFMTAEPGGVKTDYLQKSVVVTDRHPAYAKEPAGATNHMLGMMANKEMINKFAGPEKLVQVVVDTVRDGIEGLGIPLRLPLGADSWTILQGSLGKAVTDHEALKATAFKTSIEGQSLAGLVKLLD